jgi:hypothetical protein
MVELLLKRLDSLLVGSDCSWLLCAGILTDGPLALAFILFQAIICHCISIVDCIANGLVTN